MVASGPAGRVAGCDTMVALGTATSSGATLFAKNSDRPPGECQPLEFVERAEHPPGASVRCQYLEIPQVRRTHRVLGSKPVWLWGFEHGINEHGLAIGNETIFAREPPAASGLLGMDLVRLGLERARTVDEAIAVLTELIEHHGQGGSGFREFEFPYNSSFLIADAGGAWILEAPGRHWAARRCRATDSISNQITIGSDWDRVSRELRAHAVREGWPVSEPFDFEETYRDVENVPRALSEGRLRCSRTRLADLSGRVDVAALRDVLRDHDVSGSRFQPGAEPESEAYYTICMHEGLSRTTASVIAPLHSSSALPLVWVSFGRPCSSLFFPVVVAPGLPEALRRGTDEPSDVLWWVFEKIALAVEAAPEKTDVVRAELDPIETELLVAGLDAARDLANLPPSDADAFAAGFMSDVAARVDAAARRALDAVG